MVKGQVVKGIGQGFKQLGTEVMEKATEESGKVFENIITGKELLGLERTMSESELDFQKKMDEREKDKEIKKLKGEINGESEVKEKTRDVEGEMEELRRQKEKEDEEKEEYYQKMKEGQRAEEQQQATEYNALMMESTNPAKQKKSRGSALAHKKKSQPDQSKMSQTQEFNGKID